MKWFCGMMRGFFEYLTHDGVHESVKDVSDTHFQCFCFEKIVIPANALSYLLTPDSLLFP